MCLCVCANTHTHTVCTPVVAKATSSNLPLLLLPRQVQQGKSEIRMTAVFCHLSTLFSQPVAQIPPSIPMSPWGRWNLKWRFNEISGIVLWLDHSGFIRMGWSPIFTSVLERRSTVSNCKASGQAGEQKEGRLGERVNIEIRKNNTKRNGRTCSKGHTGHTGELSRMHMYPHIPYVRSLKCNQWPCQQPAPCGADC